MIRRIRHSSQQKQEGVSRKQFGELLEAHNFVTVDISPDHGEDILVQIYDETGVSTGLSFYVQLKSVAHHENHLLKTGDISYPFEVKDIEHWAAQAVTVILVVWDVTIRRGWWIWINDAIQFLDKNSADWNSKKKVNVHLPFRNELNHAGLLEIRHLLADLYFSIVSKGKDLIINAKFSFPQTPDGKAKFDELGRLFATGEAVKLQGQYIEAFDLPEWWQRLYGKIDLLSMNLWIGSTRSLTPKPYQLEFISEAQREQIPYIELWATKQGNEEITLENDRQNTPLKISIILNTAVKRHTVRLQASFWGSNCATVMQVLSIQQILSQGGHLKLTLLSTGDVSNLPVDSHNIPPPEKVMVDFVRRLCLIQKTVGVQMNFPSNGALKVEDMKAAEEMASIIEKGSYQESGVVFPVDVQKPGIKTLLDRPYQDTPIYFHLTTDESFVEILLQKIELGPMLQKIRGYWEMPLEVVKSWYEQAKDDDSLSVRLVKAELYEEFEKWVRK